MRVLRQCVGAAEHEQRAVQHVVEIEDPRGRRVQGVALQDLDADDRHQEHDQPGEGFADPGADAVDGVQDRLDVHSGLPQLDVNEAGNDKAPSGSRMVLCLRLGRRQIGDFAFGPK